LKQIRAGPLDDFGAGFQLLLLPEALRRRHRKIDGGFRARPATDEGNRIFVKAPRRRARVEQAGGGEWVENRETWAS
jgi:ribosomal protein L34